LYADPERELTRRGGCPGRIVGDEPSEKLKAELKVYKLETKLGLHGRQC
jgi:hypothetical protein